MLPAPRSQVRQNYHPDREAAVNGHFTLELHASFVCLAAAFYLDSDDLALKHFTRFFLRRSHEHSGRAQGLMCLQNQRGGRLNFQDIRKPIPKPNKVEKVNYMLTTRMYNPDLLKPEG
ncbi:PREDICTED: ferritin heavy chain-like [Lipotes vexillifer]|uniref:Ferritin n=1 Tax=Lipotes vexillifer TaxID=118797 RepID=A0A340WGG1_LIPVE|nr:PREDICTED: ferritin heavy chain-like [Lipotes vexillifer]